MTVLDRTRHPGVPFDPTRELRHGNARAARDVADWLAYLQVSNKASRTVEAYRNTAELLLAAFPDTPFDEFNDGHLLHVLAGIPPKSRHQHRSHFSSLFGWGFKVARRIPENPVDRVPSIRYEPDRVYDIFTEAESDALCGLPLPDGPLMEILLWGGLRRAEARSLQAKRVDLDRRQIVVVDGAKRSKSRLVPLFSRVESAVSELLILEGIGRDEYLWYGERANACVRRTLRAAPIGNTRFQKWWEECLADAGVRYRRPHMTRHTYATRLRERGVPLEDIQKFLGHSSIQVTADTYVHGDAETRADRLRAIFEDA